MNEKQTHAPASSFSVKLGNTTYTVGIHFGKIKTQQWRTRSSISYLKMLKSRVYLPQRKEFIAQNEYPLSFEVVA